MLKNKNHFCCDKMSYYAAKDRELEYDPQFRSYYLLLKNGAYGTHQEILYCPWCGTKLPKDLDGVWSETLKREYGIKDPIFDDADKVPPEFRTDEWWKKRGL